MATAVLYKSETIYLVDFFFSHISWACFWDFFLSFSRGVSSWQSWGSNMLWPWVWELGQNIKNMLTNIKKQNPIYKWEMGLFLSWLNGSEWSLSIGWWNISTLTGEEILKNWRLSVMSGIKMKNVKTTSCSRDRAFQREKDILVFSFVSWG